MRRLAPLLATCALALAACGNVFEEGGVFDESPTTTAPDSSTPAPPVKGSAIENGPSLNEVIPNIQQFWTDSYSKLGRSGSFTPVASSRVFALKPGQEAGPCDRAYASYTDDVEGNAFAVSCREGPMVVYDAKGLIPDLRKRFGGLGPAIVLAHEWGHVAQFQARISFRQDVYAEQQADCFAGAWFTAAKTKFAQLSSKAALDRTIGALLEFRDEPGASARDQQAHGSGFDRVRAFQEGYDRGVEFCAGYSRNPPTLVELPFSDRNDALSGGDTPYDQLRDDLIKSLNLYATSLVSSTPTLTKVESITTYKGTCNGAKVKKSDGPVVLCSKESVILVDADNLRAQVANYGDGTVSVIFAVEWAELMRVAAGEKPDDRSIGPLLQQLCVAGGWFQTLIKATGDAPLRFSPGDLDEAIGALAAASEGGSLGEGELFEAVAAMRQGVLQGGTSCALGR